LDVSVLAEVAISKFADHMPLSRQIDRVGRLGVELSLSTLSGNLLTIAEVWLKSLIDALWVVLCQRMSLHVDETVLPTLPEPGSGDRQTKKTRLWTYLNDTGPPIILFHYTQSKAGQHVRDVLSDWKAPTDAACALYLHADAASNYDALYRQNPHIKPVNCWAHARRKFYAIAGESSSRIFAHEAVEQIDVLFAYERAWKTLSTEERFTQRQAKAIPQLDKIHAMLSEKLIHQSPNSATGQAINYLLKRWENFTRYTAHGDLVMSNNAAERALRKAALGRKNFLFVGNERGGEAAATYYSLIETAKANGIEPSQWLLNALRELPKRKGSSFQDVKDLLPIKGASQL
jgi:transposase